MIWRSSKFFVIRFGDYLVPTSTTGIVSDAEYRMAKKWVWLYKEMIFMNNDIKFLNIEWTPYPLTNFEDCFGLRASVIFLDSNIGISPTLHCIGSTVVIEEEHKPELYSQKAPCISPSWAS